MSDTFTASNGITVSVEPDGDMFLKNVPGVTESVWFRKTTTIALREFFLHERDKELGRWRWPENPDYVVYLAETAGHTGSDYQECAVVDEANGYRQEFGSDLLQCHGGNFRAAARAYFAAHPEPRPWHDAKPGEVWALEHAVFGETAWYVSEDFISGKSTFVPTLSTDPDLVGMGITAPGIKSARKIWPEVPRE